MEQNPAIALFLALGIIIAASRIGGTISRRFGQPRVLGELIVGVILGPSLLDLLNAPVLNGVDLHQTITNLAELGVLLLMFIVGLEVNIKELAKVGKIAGIAGVSGAIAPVILGYSTGDAVRLFVAARFVCGRDAGGDLGQYFGASHA